MPKKALKRLPNDAPIFVYFPTATRCKGAVHQRLFSGEEKKKKKKGMLVRRGEERREKKNKRNR